MLTNDRYIRHSKMVNFSYTITIRVHHQPKGDTQKKVNDVHKFIHSLSIYVIKLTTREHTQKPKSSLSSQSCRHRIVIEEED